MILSIKQLRILFIAIAYTLGLFSLLLTPAYATAFPVTELVSTDSSNNQANNFSTNAHVSGDGVFVTFQSVANNLVASDTNGKTDVFVKNLVSGQVNLISVNNMGNQSPIGATQPSISEDGRFIVFQSSQLQPTSSFTTQIFVRDTMLGTTELVSKNSMGDIANQESFSANISADGRFITFSSRASNLDSNVNTGILNLFVHDRQSGFTEVVSQDTNEVPSNGSSLNSSLSSISRDGRYVAFISSATNLVNNDTNSRDDAFIRDRQLGITTRVSIANNGSQAQLQTDRVAISDDGNSILLRSWSNLATDGTPSTPRAYLRDAITSSTISASSGTVVGIDITSDGEFAVFQSGNSIVLRDVMSSTASTIANGGSQEAANPTISDSGITVAFESFSSTIVAGDTNNTGDVFVYRSAEESQPLQCNGLEPTILGTEGDDVINGTSGVDIIMGLGGNDTIKGKQGDDVICGGDGDDIIHGDRGNDVILGDAGDDELRGNENNDTITDLEGNNIVLGGIGSDTIATGDGNDDIQGNQSADVIDAGDGDNIVQGGTGADIITTGSGNDDIQGNQEPDIISSGAGNDLIEAGFGDDQVDAGDGDDDIEGNQGADFLDGGTGTNTIDGGTGVDTCVNGIFTACEL